MPEKFNFEIYLLSIGAKFHGLRKGKIPMPVKVAEYEYKNYQFVIVSNELGIKTTLGIMQNWDAMESKYCASIPRTESFARELIDHITNYKGELEEEDTLN